MGIHDNFQGTTRRDYAARYTLMHLPEGHSFTGNMRATEAFRAGGTARGFCSGSWVFFSVRVPEFQDLGF